MYTLPDSIKSSVVVKKNFDQSSGKEVPIFVDKVHEQCAFDENLKNRLKIQKSLCITTKTCTQIEIFKRNYLENYNDSEQKMLHFSSTF